jgi:DNA mismatch repair protein MutS2
VQGKGNTYLNTQQNSLRKVQTGQPQEEFQQELDLFQRTLDTLDYPIVLQSLMQNCGTVPAREIVSKAIRNEKPKMKSKKKKKKSVMMEMGLTANNVEEIHERYQAVSEMKIVLSGDAEIPRTSDRKAKKIYAPPLTSSFDVQPMWEKSEAGGVLDGPDILEISTIMQACVKISKWCNTLEKARIWAAPGMEKEEKDESPFKQLPKYGESIFIDSDLLNLLESSFDEDGRLSGHTFQGIGRLRAKVRTLKRDILSTLDTFMTSPSVKNKVSMESGGSLYSEVNGRIVIPISEQYASSVGIVHDMSRSGKTAYIEPSEIVRPTNEMNQAIAELKQEEAKVWRMLTNSILDSKDDIDQSIAVVAQLDLVLARIRLGDKISGIIPEVGNEGVVSLKNARHPVLLLRELENVVGSDIDLGAGTNQGLVRSVCFFHSF